MLKIVVESTDQHLVVQLLVLPKTHALLRNHCTHPHHPPAATTVQSSSYETVWYCCLTLTRPTSALPITMVNITSKYRGAIDLARHHFLQNFLDSWRRRLRTASFVVFEFRVRELKIRRVWSSDIGDRALMLSQVHGVLMNELRDRARGRCRSRPTAMSRWCYVLGNGGGGWWLWLLLSWSSLTTTSPWKLGQALWSIIVKLSMTP